jgi:hypothetical protein
MKMLLVAPLTFGNRERRLAVVAAAAEFVLIERIHLHARPAFFVFEDGGMAAAAFEHRSMDLMAEDGGGHVPRGVTEILLHDCRHFMALGAVFGGECRLSVMAFSAEVATIHGIHRYVRRAFFHLEDLRVTFAAAVFSCMVLVGEIHRHAGRGVRKRREVMAVIAGGLVEIHLLVRLYYMTLVAMDSEGDMLRMRELSGHVFRKFLIGMAFETRKTGVLQRHEYRRLRHLLFRRLSRTPFAGSEKKGKRKDNDHSSCHHTS